MNLAGKVAIVTGGNRGAGSGIGLALAGAGANIALCYHGDENAAIDIVSKVENMLRKALVLQADLTNPSHGKRGYGRNR